jgi:hypothetical protein
VVKIIRCRGADLRLGQHTCAWGEAESIDSLAAQVRVDIGRVSQEYTRPLHFSREWTEGRFGEVVLCLTERQDFVDASTKREVFGPLWLIR